MVKVGLVFSIATAIIGDFSGKYLAEYQPEKLAAAEWHFETSEAAPLILYGILDGEEVKYAIKIPFALSILAHNDPNAEVIGLDQFPEDEIPPLYIHYFFDIMVTIGMFMVMLSAFYVVAKWRKWKFANSRFILWLIVAGGPLSMIAIQAGWWMTEVGRQPWILYQIMTVEQGATSSGSVDIMVVAFAILYLILGIGSVVVLRRMFRNNPVEKELDKLDQERLEGDTK